ncbi:MAG TPA: hypothetical protein V6D18_14750 [Thermosynechococcaceae cyanobacterium]
MPEPTERLPATDAKKLDEAMQDDRTFDPQDLVYKGGYSGNPREILDNPAVAPQTIDEPGDLRDDRMPDD